MSCDFHIANSDWYPLLKENARRMRNNPTEAEAFLWKKLKGNALGVSFKRQCVVLDFIADFICIEKGLIIEVDGAYHGQSEQIFLDEARTQRLCSKGYRVIRFTNEQVLCDIDNTVNTIKTILQTNKNEEDE